MSVLARRMAVAHPMDFTIALTASTAHSQTAGDVACRHAISNVPIDTSVGLPGPTRLLIDFDFVGRDGLNPTLSFEWPGGSSCS